LNEENPKQLRLFLGVFVFSMFAYVTFFAGCEIYRRHRGPWEVQFGSDPDGTPMVTVAQRFLQLTNVTLRFPGERAVTPLREDQRLIRYDRPNTNATPFGPVIFQDATFLPGTVTFDLFGHEVELLPRTLIIDRHEHPWITGTNVVVSAATKLPPEQRNSSGRRE
jgi:hypothetical protein